ncbi:MAG: DUF4124 domain-containing protein [Pseudomonadota bacterium]
MDQQEPQGPVPDFSTESARMWTGTADNRNLPQLRYTIDLQPTLVRKRFHMNRLVLLFLLALFQQSAFSAVYKCDQAGGKTEYQATPCANGREIAIKNTQGAAANVASSAAPAQTHATPKKCVGKELTLRFTDMSVKATLQVLADFSGNKLLADSSVTGSGAFNYECVPWDTVLQDIAAQHSLAVKVEHGNIHARRR